MEARDSTNLWYIYFVIVTSFIREDETKIKLSFCLQLKRKDTEFLKDVDFVCISDNYWLGKEKPCITYGLRGICYFFIEIEGCAMVNRLENLAS